MEKQIKRIILFRFHKEFEVCKNHLDILKKFNPGVPIFGLYGGPKKDFAKAKKVGAKNVYMVPMDDWVWKWKSGDLCLRWWYKEIGHKLAFDMLHVVEWDMLLLDSVENIFSHVTEGITVSHLQPLAPIYDSWFWTAKKLGRAEFLELKKYAKENFGYNKKPLAGIFGAAAFSKKFLEKYSAIENLPGFCNDEVRILLFAQCFDMRIQDSGVPKNYLFNAEHKKVTLENVEKYYAQGVKAFHPVWEKVSLNAKKTGRNKKKPLWE